MLPLQWAQLTETVHTARLGHEFVFVFFWVAWFIFMLVYVLFYLGQLSHFLSCFGTGVTNLNEPPSSFMLPPHYCGLGAGSIPFRAIANNMPHGVGATAQSDCSPSAIYATRLQSLMLPRSTLCDASNGDYVVPSEVEERSHWPESDVKTHRWGPIFFRKFRV